jgi:hypothetical protein
VRDPRRWLWKVTGVVAAIAVLAAPLAYGAPLLLTLPVLAALAANLAVGPSGSLRSPVLATPLGVLLLVAVVWFVGRADEVLWEAVASASMAVCTSGGLRRLRRWNQQGGFFGRTTWPVP